MKTTLKKTLSTILAAVMLFGIFIFSPAASAETSGDWEYYIAEDEKAVINGYIGEGGDVTIPSEIDGYPVTEITGSHNSFYGQCGIFFAKNVTSVIIPDSVTRINDGAFSRCVFLTGATIPDSVTRIGAAFAGCYSLTSVTIGKGVTLIDRFAFEGTSLTEVYYNGTQDQWVHIEFLEHPDLYLANDPLTSATIHCSDGDYTYHEHDFIESGMVVPTCTEDGSVTFVCSICGYGYTDYLQPYGHIYGSDGNAEYCSVCGEKNPDYKPPVSFKDVKPGAYYADPVAWAVANNITAGTSATTFSPDEGCTRGQVVTFLWRAAGSPEPEGAKNPFRDVKESDYFYKAVLWAVDNGVTAGTSATTFSPDDVCTRGQIVTFQWRANGKPTPSKTGNPFKDVKSGDYFYDAVLWAVEKGITLGTDATHFSPSDTCTRGQVVTFLYRDASN